jgi:transcriptional regulator with XRE-family HTH domain
MSDQEKQLFAQHLRTLRKAAGLTQDQLAARAGLVVATVRHYEQARRIPMFDVAIALAEALGVSVDELAEYQSGTLPRKPKK